MNYCSVTIDYSACFLLAFLLLVLPIKWVVAFLLAVFVHELCHYAALKLRLKRVNSFHIGICGMEMETESLSYGEEFMCAIAGPIGGLLLLAVYQYFPELSVCGLFQSLYNLLPIFPLDGGRAVRSVANILLPEYAGNICVGVEMAALVCIFLLTIRLKMGSYTFLTALVLIGKILYGKIPCKPPYLRVQ